MRKIILTEQEYNGLLKLLREVGGNRPYIPGSWKLLLSLVRQKVEAAERLGTPRDKSPFIPEDAKSLGLLAYVTSGWTEEQRAAVIAAAEADLEEVP